MMVVRPRFTCGHGRDDDDPITATGPSSMLAASLGFWHPLVDCCIPHTHTHIVASVPQQQHQTDIARDPTNSFLSRNLKKK